MEKIDNVKEIPSIMGTIVLDFKGNPKIKLTSDKPEVTFELCTNDINFLKANVEKNWIIVPIEE